MILPFVNFNLATFRCAEFGFLGFLINTLKHIPFFCGLPSKAGVLPQTFLNIDVFLDFWP